MSGPTWELAVPQHIDTAGRLRDWSEAFVLSARPMRHARASADERARQIPRVRMDHRCRQRAHGWPDASEWARSSLSPTHAPTHDAVLAAAFDRSSFGSL